MTVDLFTPLGLDAAMASLEQDLVAPGGPSISTMRNHNFAILLYLPAKEFQLRQRVRQMIGRLEANSDHRACRSSSSENADSALARPSAH
jgi:hypothetical protein